MTPSRLTASLARGRVGSISPSTFIHVLRLVQSEYVPGQRLYSTVNGTERGTCGGDLRVESSLQALRRAGSPFKPSITGRRYASTSKDPAVKGHETRDRPRQPVPEDVSPAGAADSESVFRFWTGDDDAMPEEKPRLAKTDENPSGSRPGNRAKSLDALPVVKARSTSGVDSTLNPDPRAPPVPLPIKREIPAHVRSVDNQEMHIRMPTDRRSQMTRLDGRMEYDRYLRRFTELDEGPSRILNQGAPTDDPNYLTRDPNWYRYGYRIGNVLRIPKPEDKLQYLDNTRHLETGARSRLRDIKAILKPGQGEKRFGHAKWSSDPLQSRFFRRRIGTPPSSSRRKRLVVEQHSSPSTPSVIPRNRYSSRRQRSLRISHHVPSSTIYPRIPARSRRKRIRVRLRRSFKTGNSDPDTNTFLNHQSPEEPTPPHFLDSRPRFSRFAKLQKRVHSGAIKLIPRGRSSTSASYDPPGSNSPSEASNQSAATRRTRGGDNPASATPLFPETPTITTLPPPSLDSPDFIGPSFDSTTCVRLLDPLRKMELNEHDISTIAMVSDFLANPSVSIEACRSRDGADIPGTLSMAQIKKELVDRRQFEIAELIAIVESMPKELIYLASTTSIQQLVYDFQRLATPSHWLWLSGQLIDMLRAVSMAAQRSFEPSLFPVAYSVIGLALARSAYGQSDQEITSTLEHLSHSALELASAIRRALGDGQSHLDQKGEAGEEASTLTDGEQTDLVSLPVAYEQSVMAVSAAHLGDWEDARSRMAISLSANFAISETYPHHGARLLLEYHDLLASSGRLGDLVQLVFTVGPSLQHPLLQFKDTLSRNLLLSRIFYDAIASIEEPLDWLDKTFGWSNGHDPARVVYTALTRFTSKTDDALELAERMYTHDMYIPLDASARLCGSLFRLGRHEEAQTLYGITRARNSGASHLFLSSMLSHFTDAGLLEEAMRVNQEIISTYGFRDRDQVVIPTKLAEQGRPEETLQLLRNSFGPSWADDERLLLILSRAHHQANDAKGAERLHRRMLQIRPDTANYNRMIDFYARQGDTNRSLDVFKSLLESEISPDVHTFERLVKLFADRQDLSNVSLLLDAMSHAEIEPNDRISASVLQAHVNSGDWLGAATCWRSLPSEMQNAPLVAAAILRAFVMLGTPSDIVFSVFQSIDQPTASHWAILLLSYCDAGEMASAANVFETMDQRSRTITKAPAPNLYTYSILLYGFLRHNKSELARATFDEMLRRHVMPSNVTYASIIQSFIDSGDSSLGGLGRIHQFAMSIHASVTNGGMSSESTSQFEAVRDVFAGMVSVAGRAGEIETAQAYFDVAVPNPKQPRARDITTIGRLMDAYRKEKDIDNVLKMWRMAFKAATQLRGDVNLTMTSLSKKAEDESEVASSPSNLLCVSLNIVMSALADVGNYSLLIEVWNEVRMEGFGFSPQNFNDYAVALAKCGDVEGAFYVVDKVLVPRDRKMREQRRATMAAVLGETSGEVGGQAGETEADEVSDPRRTESAIRTSSEATAESPVESPQTEPLDEQDDTVEGPMGYDKSLPLRQRLPAALYGSEMVEEGDTYDPALFGTAAAFVNEGPPAIASTVAHSRQPLSHRGVQSAKIRSDLMAKQQERMGSVPLPTEGVTDLTAHLLTHLRPENSSWRPTQKLWETLDTAYRELQAQRKELAEQVTASRLALIQCTPGERNDSLNLSEEKELDEIDPRRQPREMALTKFNNVLVRDRHGRPMKSTPVVVLWRLNAIYPRVVKGIYKFRQHAVGLSLQKRVASADRTFEKHRSRHRQLIKGERARLMESSSDGLDEQAEATLDEMRSGLRKRRERERQRIMDRVKIPVIRDPHRYGMTTGDATPERPDSHRTNDHDRRTSKAIATVRAYQKKQSERDEANTPRLRPEYDSVLRHGRKRSPAKVKVLTPRVILKRLGLKQSTIDPGSMDRFANMVKRHQRAEVAGEAVIQSRAAEAKQRHKQTDYGRLLEDFRVRKMELQERYRQAARAEAEAEDEKQRANG